MKKAFWAFLRITKKNLFKNKIHFLTQWSTYVHKKLIGIFHILKKKLSSKWQQFFWIWPLELNCFQSEKLFDTKKERMKIQINPTKNWLGRKKSFYAILLQNNMTDVNSFRWCIETCFILCWNPLIWKFSIYRFFIIICVQAKQYTNRSFSGYFWLFFQLSGTNFSMTHQTHTIPW